jgi:hypothetical protein
MPPVQNHATGILIMLILHIVTWSPRWRVAAILQLADGTQNLIPSVSPANNRARDKQAVGA